MWHFDTFWSFNNSLQCELQWGASGKVTHSYKWLEAVDICGRCWIWSRDERQTAFEEHCACNCFFAITTHHNHTANIQKIAQQVKLWSQVMVCYNSQKLVHLGEFAQSEHLKIFMAVSIRKSPSLMALDVHPMSPTDPPKKGNPTHLFPSDWRRPELGRWWNMWDILRYGREEIANDHCLSLSCIGQNASNLDQDWNISGQTFWPIATKSCFQWLSVAPHGSPINRKSSARPNPCIVVAPAQIGTSDFFCFQFQLHPFD